jgi:hypothetical protein
MNEDCDHSVTIPRTEYTHLLQIAADGGPVASPRRFPQHSSSRCEVKVGVPRSSITGASPESCPPLSASGARSAPLRQPRAFVVGLRQKLLRAVKALLEILERKLIRHGRTANEQSCVLAPYDQRLKLRAARRMEQTEWT